VKPTDLENLLSRLKRQVIPGPEQRLRKSHPRVFLDSSVYGTSP
jgi:hypothetical protein